MKITKLLLSLCLFIGIHSCDDDPVIAPNSAEPIVQAPEPTVQNLNNLETAVAEQLEGGMPGKEVTVSKMDMDSLAETLPKGQGLNDKQQLEMWNHSIHKQMKGVLNIMCREYKKGTLDKNKKLAYAKSGLKTLHVQKGPGAEVKDDSYVAIQFVAMTTDGVEFDHQFNKDRYFRFKLGKDEVIPGLEEGVKQLRAGGKAVFFIPPALAFGDKGRVGVPANAEVAYLVSLAQVN